MAIATPSHGATILRVAPTGQNSAGCGTEASPCRTIQYAINQIPSTGTVLVAGSPGGTKYTFDPATDICSPPLAYTGVVCVVNKEIVLRGGYSKTNWSTSSPDANLTIIDGEGSHRGILVADTGPPTSLELDGFTVRNAFATGSPGRPGLEAFYGAGAGLLADVVDHLVIRNTRFAHNVVQGGDVATEFGGAGGGGGVGLRGVPDALIEDVRFEDNVARGGSGAVRGGYAHGGAIYTFQSTLIGHRIAFDGNQAIAGDTAGDGQSSDGQRADALGGAASFQHGTVVTLDSISARENAAIGGNATVHAGGGFGGALNGEEATIQLTDGDLRDNLAVGGNAQNGYVGEGGAITTIHSALTLDRVTVIGNVARGGNGTSGDQGPPGGGGVTVLWTTPGKTASFTFTNGVVADNAAEPGAGTIVTGGGGGGIWIQGMTATLRHVTVARNEIGATMGAQAILLIQSIVPNQAPQGAALDLQHSIVADHTPVNGGQAAAIHVGVGCSATFTQGLFAGNTRDTNASDPPGARGTLVNLASMQTAGSAAFVSPGPPSFDYHLTAGSPARNQATTSSTSDDVDGELRSAQLPRDIGADEWSSPGAIEGTVRDGGNVVAGGVDVLASRVATGAPAGKATTDGAGKYQLTNLPPGSYRIFFADAAMPRRFMSEWYDDRASQNAANTVTVAVGATTQGVDAALSKAPSCRGLRPTIVGTRGSDVIHGTDGPDVIVGGAGNDEIDGGDGDDTICGGGGDDDLDGGKSNDYLNGGGGNDVLRGRAGNDILRDAGGSDTLLGGSEDDDLKDLKGDNLLSGGQGTDRCQAAPGNAVSACER
ncbi:MAG TPA: carboxypeptidase regulatory-like domain-containing protein [Candidatus Binatia bacterium]|nr:carboxypeptidase regulatory-like domain-containing protein [Candidatus Binatia bacterium]